MPRQHDRLTGQRKNFFPDPPQKNLSVPARQVPTADPAMKKNVTANQCALIRKIKTKTSRAVPRHVKYVRRKPEQVLAAPFRQQAIQDDWLDPPSESEPLKKILLRHHRHRNGVADHPTPVAFLYRRCVRRVIPVTVGQHQKVHFFPGKLLVGPFGGIKEDIPPGRLNQKAVCFVRSTGKCFELQHTWSVKPTCLIFLAQSVSQGDLLATTQ